MSDEMNLRMAALRWAHFHEDCTDVENVCPVREECSCYISVLCDTHVAADLIESLAAELEQVKRERDAAVNLLRHYECNSCIYEKVYATDEPCANCEHNYAWDCKIPRSDNWQWRGAKMDLEV